MNDIEKALIEKIFYDEFLPSLSKDYVHHLHQTWIGFNGGYIAGAKQGRLNMLDKMKNQIMYQSKKDNLDLTSNLKYIDSELKKLRKS